MAEGKMDVFVPVDLCQATRKFKEETGEVLSVGPQSIDLAHGTAHALMLKALEKKRDAAEMEIVADQILRLNPRPCTCFPEKLSNEVDPQDPPRWDKLFEFINKEGDYYPVSPLSPTKVKIIFDDGSEGHYVWLDGAWRHYEPGGE